MNYSYLVRIVNFIIADLNITARKKQRREQKLPLKRHSLPENLLTLLTVGA